MSLTRDCKHGQLARQCNICELEDEAESLRAELAEVRRDAERYRWLRSDDCPFSCYEQEGPDNWGWCPTSSRDLDEAIDAAMAGDSAPESAATATRLWGGDAKWEGSMHTDYSHYWPVNWRPQDERILATMGADVPRIPVDVGASPDNLREVPLPLTNRVEMHR